MIDRIRASDAALHFVGRAINAKLKATVATFPMVPIVGVDHVCETRQRIVERVHFVVSLAQARVRKRNAERLLASLESTGAVNPTRWKLIGCEWTILN